MGLPVMPWAEKQCWWAGSTIHNSAVGWIAVRYRATMILSVIFHAESPMHRFLYRLALGTVLLHMTCGCCWHHAHGSPVAGRPTTAQTCCRAGGHGHDHGDHGGHDHDGHDHDGHDHGDRPCDRDCPQRGCGGEQCVFTRSDPGGTAELPIDRQCVSLMCICPDAATPQGTEVPAAGLFGRHPAVGLHLLNRALLL